MPKFRKKPIVIEAIQFTGEESLCDIFKLQGVKPARTITASHGSIYISTLEGKMEARPGDWIIKGIKGECYPCKPDIFEATYELV